MTGTGPLVSVVIPSFERVSELRTCLQALEAQTSPPNVFEVVVVDDGSEADYGGLAGEFAGRLDLRVLRRPHRGVAEARNAAIRAARAPVLILLDDDLVPEPDTVARCLSFHREHEVDTDLLLLGIAADEAAKSAPLYRFLESAGRVFELPPRRGVYGHEYFWGGALSARRSLFERGLFAPGLQATEDTELGARLASQAPLRIHWDGGTPLHFRRRLEIRGYERREYLLGYHRYFRQFDVDWLAGAYAATPPYAEPGRFLITNERDLALLHEAADELEAMVEGSGGPERAAHQAELDATYRRLLGHAMARGWRDAYLGRPPSPAPRAVSPEALTRPPEDDMLPHARWRRTTGRPLLTASLICKNEEDHIGACLASLADLVDEVVVVDTGSTDRTVAIARACGARVEIDPWRDDFAAARNRSLDLVRGEWVLYIDADERLVRCDADDLRARLRDPGLVGLRVLLRSHEGATPFWEIRLFRSDPDIRFEGVIHETIWPSLLAGAARTGRGIEDVPVAVDHLGYAGDQSRKHRRNLPLLLKSLEVDPWKVFNWNHLATIYADLGDDEQAERAWARALDAARDAPHQPLTDSGAFVTYIEWLRSRGRDFDPVLDEAIARYPANLYVAWLDGNRRFERGDPAGAVARYRTVLAGADPARRDQSIGYAEDLFGVWTLAPLADALLALEEFAEAAALYGELERRYPGALEFRVKRVLAASHVSGTHREPQEGGG